MIVEDLLSLGEIEELSIASDRPVESSSFYNGSLGSIPADSAVTLAGFKRAGLNFSHGEDDYFKNIPLYESNGNYRVSLHDIKKHACDTLLMDAVVNDSSNDPSSFFRECQVKSKFIEGDVIKGLRRNNIEVVNCRLEEIGSYRHAVRDLFTTDSIEVFDISKVELPGECFELAIFGINPSRIIEWINEFQHSILSHSRDKSHLQYIGHGKIGITRYNLYGDDSLTVLCTENSIVSKRNKWLSLVRDRWLNDSGRIEEI